MLSLSLILVMSMALVADPSPEELIGHLASADRVVREEAARTLEELGREVLPALRAALGSAQEPEAHERFGGLIDRIETRTLGQPAQVSLDVEDRPLGEAVETLAKQSGHMIAIDDASNPALVDRRVTVHSAEPLPFWEALDRLGHAGHIRYDPGGRQDRFGRDPRASTIRLVDGDPAGFTTVSGPLRLQLFATHRHRDLNFRKSDASRYQKNKNSVNIDVDVEIQAFAEPGRFLNTNGLPRVEAVDEQGRVLSSIASGGEAVVNAAGQSWNISAALSLLHWRIPVGLPERPAQPHLTLRGVLPVLISARRPEPLVIPLEGGDGKAFRQGGASFQVMKLSVNALKMTELDLLIDSGKRPPDDAPGQSEVKADYPADYLMNRLEFRDAEGRIMNWQLIGGRAGSAPQGRLVAKIFVSGDQPPASLLVFRLNHLSAEIPFEFREVPSP